MTALAVETGWSEVFILVWLPLARAEQYYHTLLRRAGWSTYLPAPPVGEQLAAFDDGADDRAMSDTDPELEAAFARFQNQR